MKMANTSVILDGAHFINASSNKQSVDPLTYERVHVGSGNWVEDDNYERGVGIKQYSQDSGQQNDNFVLLGNHESNIHERLGNRNKNMKLSKSSEFHQTVNKGEFYNIPQIFIGKTEIRDKQTNITGILHFDLNMRNKAKKPSHSFLEHSLNLSGIESRNNRPIFLLGSELFFASQSTDPVMSNSSTSKENPQVFLHSRHLNWDSAYTVSFLLKCAPLVSKLNSMNQECRIFFYLRIGSRGGISEISCQ